MLQTILSSNNNNSPNGVGSASNTMRLLSQLLTSPQVKFQQNVSSDFVLKHTQLDNANNASTGNSILCDYKPKKQRVKLNPIPIPIPAPSSPESDYEINNKNTFTNGEFSHIFLFLFCL